MVFGTFDVIHPGHKHFFAQARKLARTLSRRAGQSTRPPRQRLGHRSRQPYLIVSVARDANVKRIKGRAPRHKERQRLAAIKKLSKSSRLVDKAMLGGLRDHLPHIIREQPDVIALGHDQVEYTDGLRGALNRRGLKTKIVRLKPFRRKYYRSSFYKREKATSE